MFLLVVDLIVGWLIFQENLLLQISSVFYSTNLLKIFLFHYY